VELLPLRTQYGRVDETHTFSPSLLNEFGLAVDRFHSITSSQTTLPIFQGFFINLGSLPGPQLFNQTNANTAYQVLESLTKTAGHHTLKFGADIRVVRSNTTLRNNQAFSFASFSDLANNRPFTLQTLGYPMIGLNNSNWDFYAQDDWRVRPGLTINLGLRYEYNTVITESHGRLRNFDVATQSFVPSSEGAYKPDRNNFAPRLGFSWDPAGKGKTVIHGFGGIFYLPFLVGSLNSLSSNIPAFAGETINAFQAPLAFPEPNPPVIAGAQNIQSFARDSRDTYSAQWSLGIQQEVAPATVLEVNYLGWKTNHAPAGAAYAGLEVNPLDPLTGRRPYPNFADERQLGTFLQANYHAMQAILRRRAGRFNFDANYTWAHEIDNTLNVFGTFENPYNYNLDHASGDVDVRHNFSADIVYALPDLKGRTGLVHTLFGEWQASSIFQARSGLPLNVQLESGFFAAPFRPNYVGGQPAYLSNAHTPDSSLNPAVYAIQPDYNQTLTVGTLGRNTARGPTFFQWDLSAMKSFPFGEKVRVQFRADIFNLLNHPNFGNPDTGLCNSINLPNAATGTPASCVANPNFGRSGATIGTLIGTGTSRQAQLALRLTF
jgi:outer membrane receptor protein involved in Fe transport